MFAPNTMCVHCDESVANFRTGPDRKWKLRDQRDPGWSYHRLPEQHQAIYAMYRTKLRKDVLQCSPKNKRNQKLKELLQLKFLTLIFYERRELETRRLFSIDRKKFLGLVRTEIILTSISPVPAADQNVWNCSRKSIG